MKSLKLGATVLIAGLLAGCGGGNSTPVGITIAPTSATVVLNGNEQFTATVTGTISNMTVNWAVSQGSGTPVPGGNSTLGTVSSTGLYTAPAALPNPPTVSVVAIAAASAAVTASATVTIDSGVRVQVLPASATIGTGETLSFTATVTGTTNAAVNWSVNNIAGGNSTVGMISTTGVYTAPSSAMSVTISASSAVDSSKSGTAAVSVVAAVDPTLSSLDLTTAAQGSIFQDVYANGTNFFSTSTLRVNGMPIPTTFISVTLLRGRIPSSLLTTVGPETVNVQAQNGHTSSPAVLTVTPVRPAVISSSPDSVAQGSSSASVNLNGGFYSPATTAKFNGQPRVVTISNTRQLSVALNGSDLNSPGLFPLVVRNSGASGISAVNLAIEPLKGAIASLPTTVGVGKQPSAVAINTATGTGVVANTGDNTISLINLSSNTVTQTIAVGNKPTGVAVDNVLNFAITANSGDNTLSVVNLTTSAVTSVSLPSGTTPFSVGVNPINHRALIANSSTNIAYAVDVSQSPPVVLCTLGGTNPTNSCLPGSNTNPVSTGPTPQIAVDPRLNWAIVTPGGSGTITIVDLGRAAGPGDKGRFPNPFATLTITTSIQGVAINTETEQALLTDPNSSFLGLFSVLDQGVTPVTFQTGQVASAVNSLTNIGVVVNSTSSQATVVDLSSATAPPLATVTVGTTPQAVAIDPTSNVAVIANQGSNNVSILALGSLRPLHITQASPATTLATSAFPLTLTVIGSGFSSGSLVRLDEQPLPSSAISFVSSRELVATIPANMLSTPRRYIVDVQNPDGTISNETDLAVIEAITVGSSPEGIALDSQHNLAVVTNNGDNTVSVVDLTAGTAGTAIPVGSGPQGVAVLPRLNLALVANNGSNTASIVDYLVAKNVTTTVSLPNNSAPVGVAINPDTATGVVANSGGNSVSIFGLTSTSPTVTNVGVDQRPVAVAIDPSTNVAAVAASTSGTVDLVNLPGSTMEGRATGFQVPTGLALDPVNGLFLVANSLQNTVNILDPVTLVAAQIRIGINPTSLDYNFQTSTLVTVNSASNTVSVVDFLGGRTRAVLGLDGSAQFSVAINPRTNIAVIVDQNNNRVLVVPLPR
jgi:YVTN family beta-propeller protein